MVRDLIGAGVFTSIGDVRCVTGFSESSIRRYVEGLFDVMPPRGGRNAENPRPGQNRAAGRAWAMDGGDGGQLGMRSTPRVLG